MKIINRSLLTAVLLGSVVNLPLASYAAEKASDETRAERFRARMQEVSQALGLTDDQKEKIKPIIQAEIVKLKELRAETSLTREQKVEKFKAIREEFTPQVKAILTPDQLAKWQKMREEFREKYGKGAGGN